MDSTPVQEKSFEISGVKVGYEQFDAYLCFQLVGGLFMVKNQYYSQKLTTAEGGADKERFQSLVERTKKARVLMESKSKEVSELRKNQKFSYEEKAQKTVGMLVEAYDTLKLFEPDIMNLCHVEAKKIKDKCYKMKDQALFSSCYDDMGKALNKKVLAYFNSNYAKSSKELPQ